MTENAGLKWQFKKERKYGMLGGNVSHFLFYKNTHDCINKCSLMSKSLKPWLL